MIVNSYNSYSKSSSSSRLSAPSGPISPSGVPDLATTRPVSRQVSRRLHSTDVCILPQTSHSLLSPTTTPDLPLPPQLLRCLDTHPPQFPHCRLPPPPSPPPLYPSFSRGLFWPPESQKFILHLSQLNLTLSSGARWSLFWWRVDPPLLRQTFPHPSHLHTKSNSLLTLLPVLSSPSPHAYSCPFCLSHFTPCATFRLHGAREVRRGGGGGAEHTALQPCRGKENVGRRRRNRRRNAGRKGWPPWTPP